ncbi:hypothetical protein [Ruegeria jejuensis]
MAAVPMSDPDAVGTVPNDGDKEAIGISTIERAAKSAADNPTASVTPL